MAQPLTAMHNNTPTLICEKKMCVELYTKYDSSSREA